MASSTYHTIALQGGHVRGEGIAKASAGIKPGHLLSFNSTGQLQVHGTENGVAAPVKIALESPTAAAGTTAAIDTTYADGEIVYFAYAQPGEVYYMFLAHSTGNTAVKGTSQLSSKGNGTLKVYSLSTGLTDGKLVAVPQTSLDNSAVGGAAARLPVRIA